MKFPDDSRLPAPYLEPHQARLSPPGDYENMLGDAIEAAFGAGTWDLPGLVARLNQAGIRTPDGQPWTPESFEQEMAGLAN